MRKLQFILVFLAIHSVVFGQNAAQADALFQAQQYAEARLAYETLLKRSKTPLYYYRYARCSQELGDLQTALAYFDKAGDRYPLKYLFMGDIYMQIHHPQQAIGSYQTYMDKVSDIPDVRKAHIQTQIAQAEKWERYLKRVEKLYVIDSVLVQWNAIRDYCILSPEAGILSWDSTDVRFTNQRHDRSISMLHTDSTTLLASSQRLLDDWSAPQALPSSVNIAQRQGFPYLLNDGLTLYFASNDSNGLGGYDLYVSRLNMTSGQYTQPENLGFPYNSSANDYMLITDETRHIGYLVSDRNAPTGYVHIYTFIPSDSKQYWQNLDLDTLVAYATLQQLYNPDSVVTPSSTGGEYPVLNSVEGVEPIGCELVEPAFVLNDSMQYSDSTQFRSKEAYTLYLDWQKNTILLQQTQQQLHILRQSYSDADADKRRELTPAILHLEETEAALAEQCIAEEKMIRRLELGAGVPSISK